MFSLKKLFGTKSGTSAPEQPAPFDWAAFDHALVMKGEAEALPLIVPGKDYNQPINSNRETPLEYCLNWHKKAPALKFIACGAAVSRRNPDGVTPLCTAAGWGDTEIAQALLAKGADPNDGGKPEYTPLDAASQNNHTDIIAALLAKGAALEKPPGTERTPLIWAASCDRDAGEAVRLLLQKGAAIDTQDKEGNCALHCAVMALNEASVGLLVDAHAALNLRNRQGETPLYIACHYIRGADSAAKLIAAGADPDLADNGGRTPLMWAAVGEMHEKTLDALIDAGAWLDAQDAKGQTALMWAAGRGMESRVRRLLDAGADPSLRDASGYSAYEYAATEPKPGSEAPPVNPVVVDMIRDAQAAWAERQRDEADKQAEDSTILQKDTQVTHALRLRHLSANPV